jgi:hypothetical protein
MLQNNYIFKELVNTTGLVRDESLMMEIFELGGIDGVTSTKIRNWRTVKEGRNPQVMPDVCLVGFLAGLKAYRNQQVINHDRMVFNFPSSSKSSLIAAIERQQKGAENES